MSAWSRFKKLFGGSGGVTVGEGSPTPGAAPSSTPPSFSSSVVGPGYWGGYSSGSDGSKWDYGLSASGATPILNHYLLRNNARKTFADTSEFRAIVERFADAVVDTGLKLEPRPNMRTLGLSLDEAEEWASDVAEKFDAWARSKKCFRDETMNFYQAQRLLEVFQQRDNDYFIRFTYSDDRDLLNPLQISFIDPNQIQGFGYTNTYGFQWFSDGIERDDRGRETAYHISLLVDKFYKSVTLPAWGKSGLRMMVHGFQPEYAGQGRGYPRLSHALQEFENLTDFTLANIKKAINQSNITMYVEPSDNAPASNPFEGISHSVPAGPAAMQYGELPAPSSAAQNVSPLSLMPISYSPIQEATLGVPGSVGVFNLQEGEKLRTIDQNAPHEGYNSFVESFTSHLAASASMPVEVLLMKFNQNYSASRGALILFWRVAQIWRDELAADALNPIYESWLTGEIASGRVKAPGWQDARLRQAWLCAHWVGSSMPVIDPAKTAKADKEYLEMGATTIQRVAHDLNGSTASGNMGRLRREYEQLPIPPWADKVGKYGGSDAHWEADEQVERDERDERQGEERRLRRDRRDSRDEREGEERREDDEDDEENED